MNRRFFLTTTMGALALARPALAALPRLEVVKSPTCGCCTAWIEHMERAGFEVTAHDVDQDALYAIKAQAGITADLSACHTGVIDDYIIEGHVPAADVKRLLDERPDAIGLVVPGMPMGSPGMEMGNQRDAFDTLLLHRDGSSEVFVQHT